MAKRKAKRPTPLEKTAYHEAGHAVAYYQLRKRFKSVSIIPDDEAGFLGRVVGYPPPESFRPDIEVDARGQRRIENELFVFVCGEAAERISSGRHNWKASGHDFHTAVNLASYIYCDPEVCGAWLNFMMISARQNLRLESVRPIVKALAEELLVQKHIGYKQAKAIMRQAEEQAFEESSERDKAGKAWRDPLGK